MKSMTIATIALLLMAVTANAGVRAVHASPDAPNVDIIVNNNFAQPAFTNVPFTAVSDYAQLPTGTYNLKVVPTGQQAPVVIDANIDVDGTMDYTVIASDVLSNITPLVFVDQNTAKVGEASIRFIHLSPNAPAVDIALTNSGPVLFGNVSFQESGGYISVPAGTYDLEARLAGTNNVVLSIPGVMVEGGTVYTAYAMGLVGNAQTPLQAVLSVDYVAPAEVRVVHASPDAPNVDVVVNNDFNNRAVVDLPYTGITGYLSLPAAQYNFKVVPTGAMDPVVINADLALESAADHTVIASDFLNSITPLVLADDNTIVGDKSRVRFVHLSPDAPAVDIAVANNGPVLFANIAFQEVGDYLAVDPGFYDLEVRVAGTNIVALTVNDLGLPYDSVVTVYAMGTLNIVERPLVAVTSIDAQQFARGDMNCDGFLHFLDINPFVLALVQPAAYSAQFPDCDVMNADINQDGLVDFGDINPFIDRLNE